MTKLQNRRSKSVATNPAPSYQMAFAGSAVLFGLIVGAALLRAWVAFNHMV